MADQIDKKALERLAKRCEDAMTSLSLALQSRNVEAAKDSLHRAEVYRDALESITPPEDLKQGADFLDLKGRLFNATVNGSFELDQRVDDYDDLNDPDEIPHCHEGVHVDDYDFLRPGF